MCGAKAVWKRKVSDIKRSNQQNEPILHVLLPRYHCHTCETHDGAPTICYVCMKTCHAHHRTLVTNNYCEHCNDLLCDICTNKCLAKNHTVKRVPKHKIVGNVLLWCISLIPEKCRNNWTKKKMDSNEEAQKLSENVLNHINKSHNCNCERLTCESLKTKMEFKTVHNNSR